MATWTKNTRTNKYDIISSVGVIVGDVVTVSRKDGRATSVTVDSVSRPFTAKFGDLKGAQAVICKVTKHDSPRSVPESAPNVVEAIPAPIVTPKRETPADRKIATPERETVSVGGFPEF